MGKVQRRLCAAAAIAVLGSAALVADRLESRGPKFYPDDPLMAMPAPLDASDARPRKLSMIHDFFFMQFDQPGEKSTLENPIPAGAVNTLGEVPDSLWYVNRHGKRRMSIEELKRGPGNSTPPSLQGAWTVVAAKSEGVTPGFTIKDSAGRRYQVKFDAELNRELVTGADVMGSKWYWALGYYTPENYVVYFRPEQLQVAPDTRFVDRHGLERVMKQTDIEEILKPVPRGTDGRLRAVASLYLQGKPVGPFRFHGIRRDDPNDVVLHEHRRDLRALKVFNAWLNHHDSKSLNSLDMLQELAGVQAIRHHLIDFGAAFGAEAFTPKSPRGGYVYLLDWPDMAKSFFSLGLYVPAWARADYKHVRGIGRMESEVFKPDEWKPNYYNPAYNNCMPDDGFWAAKTVMQFTQPEIEALVETAQFTDKAAADYLVKIMVERQQKIGRTYFEKVLPLDNFRVDGGNLVFDDLAVKYGFAQPREYQVRWAAYDNKNQSRADIPAATGQAVPRSEAEYLLAEISGSDARKRVLAYLRRSGGSNHVVGLERTY
jgi:hypothetical protein